VKTATTTFTGDHTMSATLLRPTSYDPARSATTASRPSLPSRRSVIAGRVLTGIVAILLAMDAGIKLVLAKPAVEGSAALGFNPQQVFVIGVIAAVCLVLYLIPRTAPIGAVLWTGYFGGAIVTHFRLGNPLLTHVLPPIYVSILIWGSLYLRDPRVRSVVRG
jgi:DoxX-like family